MEKRCATKLIRPSKIQHPYSKEQQYCSEEVLLGVWLVSVAWRGVVWLMKSVAFSMHCCARLIVHVQLVPYVDL